MCRQTPLNTQTTYNETQFHIYFSNVIFKNILSNLPFLLTETWFSDFCCCCEIYITKYGSFPSYILNMLRGTQYYSTK